MLTQGDYHGVPAVEAVQLAMVLATFDVTISLLFKDAALMLLLPPDEPVNKSQIHISAFIKPLRNMVESFEFYDIENYYVLNSDQNLAYCRQSPYPITPIHFNRAFVAQFDHILSF